MAREHTPAPWRDDGYRIYAPDDRVITEYKHCDDGGYSDGPLLAAAPELLNELKEIIAWALNEKAPLRDKEIERIRQLIAKAEGAV